MRYFCLICDYDGTIGRDGRVPSSTVEALKKVGPSGRKLVLATGRELNDLLQAFPEVSVFDRVVAENGGVLYWPAGREKKLLADSPPREFVEELVRRGVSPLSVGESIVATWHPNESTVLAVIRRLGLELQIIFNKDAVMILPPGVNKGTGVGAALAELGLSPHNVVGVGDAENDHAFLGTCECSIAVENALPAIKDRADFVTSGSHGAGVEELIAKLLTNDLVDLEPRLNRHQIELGSMENGETLRLESYGSRLLVAGPSGSGKSTTVSVIIERLIEKRYQICLVDPEGDYDDFGAFVTLGGPDRVPGISEILEVLNTRGQCLSINLLGVPLLDRPSFSQSVLSRIQELRSKTGRPHWIIMDEVHHLLPAGLDSASLTISKDMASFILVTVHPDRVSQAILSSVNCVIAVGTEPQTVLAQFNAGAGRNVDIHRPPLRPIQSGQVVVWLVSDSRDPVQVRVPPSKTELLRHRRKYAAGELGEDKSFYFRGPKGKLNLRAQNMNMFAQLADGVDEETWAYHLSESDYSRWLRESVKDQAVADEVAAIEQNRELSPSQSRTRVLEAIRKRYTAPA